MKPYLAASKRAGLTGVFRKLPQPSVSPPEIMRKLPISGEG
jgi:hypothetical protein